MTDYVPYETVMIASDCTPDERNIVEFVKCDWTTDIDDYKGKHLFAQKDRYAIVVTGMVNKCYYYETESDAREMFEYITGVCE